MFNIIIFIVFLLYTALVIFKFRGTKFVLVNVISGFFLFVFSLGIVTDLIKVYKVTRTPKLTYAKIIGKFESGDGDGYILEYAGIENKYETSQKYKMNEPVFIQFSQKKPKNFIKLKEKVNAPLSFKEVIALKINGYKRIATISVMLILGMLFVNITFPRKMFQ